MEAFGQLTDEARALAVQVLQRRLSPSDLRTALGELEGGGARRRRKSVEWLVAETESPAASRLQSRLPNDHLARFLVDRSGVGLLELRALRERLALRASDDELERLHDYEGAARSRGGRQGRAKAVAGRRWQPGKGWPRHFVKVLDLPAVFAGLPGSKREPDLLQVDPFVPLPPLEDFQEDLKAQIISVLDGAEGSKRGVLTLPTGAGKTRTAVESLIAWRIQQQHRPLILWVAQSEELCEQAVQAFREVWTDLGQRHEQVRQSIEIARLWSTSPVPSDPDIIVASIQKLHAIVREGDSEVRPTDLLSLTERLGVVVVDEAHRILAPSYAEVLRFIGVVVPAKASSKASSNVPLLGLTATPYRHVEAETVQLAARFHGRLLSPESLGNDVVSELRGRGVLSRPEHEILTYDGPEFPLEDNIQYRDHFEQFNEFHPGFLQEVSQSLARNRLLRDRLLELPPDWPTLFFGCTVEHAIAMAVLLRRAGRTADVVTADTRSATRRALIEDFRAGRLSVLCNYGVLTTGFDAPRVRALVVARPTTSPVLYEQMIGRGMRGPRFGGTDLCTVLDIEDNIRFQGQLAFKRYAMYWESDGAG